MNLFETTNLLIEKFDSNIIVNTISFTKTDELDQDKENIYPLVNIDIISSTILDSLLEFKYTITILNQRDIDNEYNNDKIFGSNYINNINEAHTISNMFLSQLYGNPIEEMDILSVSDIVFLENKYGNGLDGVQFDLELQVENNIGCNG